MWRELPTKFIPIEVCRSHEQNVSEGRLPANVVTALNRHTSRGLIKRNQLHFGQIREQEMGDKPERRELEFNSLHDAVAEVEKLAKGEVRTTGNHTFAQIVEHLARSHDMSTGKVVGPRPPWYLRMMMPLIKGSILNGPAKPGFKLPAAAESHFWPNEVDIQQAIAHLKESVDNYYKNGPLEVHPVFGKATREQIDNLNITHCAMHLSFVHPV